MNLIDRVKNIIMDPKKEWQVINTETIATSTLITTYLLPLAIVAAVAFFIGYGFIIAYASVKIGLIWALIALIQLVLSVYINAFITDALAPSFNSEKNMMKSSQLVVYAATPSLIGNILYIIPGIGWLGALAGGIYSLYLLYLGIPVLKKTPEDKVPIYMIVIIITLVVLYYIINYILMRIFLSMLFAGTPLGGYY